MTSYVVVSGPDTMFPGPQAIRLDQVTDGLSNTLMLVEVSNTQIPWTKPEDLDLRTMSLQVNDRDEPGNLEQTSRRGQCHTRRRRYQFLPDSVTASQLRSLLTSLGGETMPADLRRLCR